MTAIMQTICDYLLENHYQEFLPREYYWHLETLSDAQWELLDQYQATRNAMHSHDLEAMFQAAWRAFRELA